MEMNSFFSSIEENEVNKKVLNSIKVYIDKNPNLQVYLINTPLGEGKKYNYDYAKNVIVILSPKHKIIFLDLIEDSLWFDRYCDDFIEDLGSISDKFNYKEYIWRPKDWRNQLISQEVIKKPLVNFTFFSKKEDFDLWKILDRNKLDSSLYRNWELLISLLIGSVNDLSKIWWASDPKTLLEKVKNKIVLFDADQTRFIYKELNQSVISIQWLAWTGKTELLLHKLKELYTKSDDSKIFFTCKNIALSRELNKRIPDFFNSMKVEKQIEKNKRLWVTSAWGSLSDINSWLYRYICHFYNIPFYNYGQVWDFDKAIKFALDEINKIDSSNFNFAFSYILIDESQDFSQAFFELCRKVTSDKVYIAWDLFQDIFSENIENREVKPDYILNKCYRTDPRTLMFAQSIWMGLFETPHLNWLKDESWRDIGYSLVRSDWYVHLSREPIRRFEDLDIANYNSMHVIPVKEDQVKQTMNIILKIKDENPTIKPDDIGIVYLDNYALLCDFANQLEFELANTIKWSINKAYENKQKIDNHIYITNQNHVKGLEFPFIICITNNISNNYSYRNTLYTMLTRSFLQSYLLVKDSSILHQYLEWLRIINNNHYIKTLEPTSTEMETIKATRIQYNKKTDIPYTDFIFNILQELGIEDKYNEAIQLLNSSRHANSFDDEAVRLFLTKNKEDL